MVDKYSNYGELNDGEEEGRDYRIRWQKRDSRVAIIAIHGGGIEPGTTEIAEAIAGNQHSFYTFEGLKPRGNRDLHITSTKFDESKALEIVREANKVVSIHSCKDEMPDCEGKKPEIVYLGGLDEDLKGNIKQSLEESGFITAKHDNLNLQGTSPRNICNRSQTGKGVQLEITRNLRDILMKNPGKFDDFVTALRNAVSH